MGGRAIVCALVVCASCRFDTSGVGEDGGQTRGAADAATIAADAAFPVDASPPAPTPIHYYGFDDGTAADSLGGADGSVAGNVIVEDGRATFPGGDDGGWIELPADQIAISEFAEVSFEARFSFAAQGAWQRVFDFGAISEHDDDLGAYNVFFTPTSGAGDTRATISSADPGFEVEAVAIAAEPIGRGAQHHVVVTLDDEHIRLYHDGQLIAEAAYADVDGEPSPRLGLLDDSLAFLGRSLYTSDAFFAGTIDEFAIFDVALEADEVAGRFAAGASAR